MKQLQDAINEWQDKTFPRTTMIAACVKLNGEVAELLTAVSTGEPIGNIADELADIIHLVCDVARCTNDHFGAQGQRIDLDRATWAKLAENHERKWNIRSDGTGQHR